MSATDRRRALVVEGEPFISQVLCEILDNLEYQSAHARDVTAARATVQETDPDIALIDYELPDGSGIDLAREFQRTAPEMVSVVLACRSTSVSRDEIPAGVGFIHVGAIEGPAALAEAIDDALRHGGSALHVDRERPDPISGLTPSQTDILRLVALGLSNAEIAKRRGLTVSGVEQSITSTLRRIAISPSDGLSPRVEAARRYIKAKGIPLRADATEQPSPADPTA